MSIPYRYDTTFPEIGKEDSDTFVSIPYRYDTTSVFIPLIHPEQKVSIPYRYDTTEEPESLYENSERCQFLIGMIRPLLEM